MSLSEAQFQRQVIELCKMYDLPVFSWPDSRRVTSRGWPDLAIVGKGCLLLAELKLEKGKLTADQLIVGALLRQLESHCDRVQYRVWRPSDMGSIHEVIREVASYQEEPV